MTRIARLKKRFYFDAAKYFRFFANKSLKRWKPRIIAVTGSAGKTTMLHLIEFELGKNLNWSLCPLFTPCLVIFYQVKLKTGKSFH